MLQGLLLGGAAAVQPGPFQALLLSLTISGGWRRAWPAAFAPLLSDGPILILVVVVLSQMPQWLVAGLQVFGGLFLFYLAWNAFRAVRAPDSVPAERVSPDGSLLKASLTNLLNPNPYIFWATIAGPILILAWTESPLNALAFLFAFFATFIGGMLIFILIVSALGQIGPRVNLVLGWVSVVALLAFGVFQLTRGIGSLIG